MTQVLPIEIVTPSRILFSSHAAMVTLPGIKGQLGILPGHTDFIGSVGSGTVCVASGSKKMWFAVSDGVFEVKDGELTILVEVGETTDEINSEAASAHLKELEKQLATINRAAEDPTELEHQRDLERARLELSKL